MAKQYPANESGNSTPTPTTTNHGVREHGAEVFTTEPKKRGFPWWVLLLALLPLLLLWNRSNNEPNDRATPVAAASASPGYTASPSADGTSRTGSAALPPAGTGTTTDR